MKVGDEVVCIDDSITDNVKIELFPNWVTEGERYTVRKVEGSIGRGQRVLLDQVRNPVTYFPELFGSAEPGFSAKRFASIEDFVEANEAVEEIKEELSLVE